MNAGPGASVGAMSRAGGVREGAAAFEPVLIVFTCNWCSYRAADLAGTARIKYPPNVRLIRLMCSGRVDPTFVLKAFAEGADGVVITGCWPADCHYRVQNVKALRRFLLLRRVVAGLGIEPERLQMFYASAAEGQRLAGEFTRIVDEVRALGPLGWNRAGMPEAATRALEEAPALDTSLAEAGDPPRNEDRAPVAAEVRA
jgi:F420-non-reducing hydrogenase iron-sulfur subunit